MYYKKSNSAKNNKYYNYQGVNANPIYVKYFNVNENTPKFS